MVLGFPRAAQDRRVLSPRKASAEPPPRMQTSPSTPTVATSRCACCGHGASAAGCTFCHGIARGFDGEVLYVGPRSAPADVWRGVRSVLRALFALLHEREYVGALRVPVAANVVVLA